MTDRLIVSKWGFFSHPSSRKLLAWLDGELDVRQARKISCHLEDCANCRRELTQIETAVEIFSAVENGLQPPDLADLADLAAGRLDLQAAMRVCAETRHGAAARREICFAQTALGRIMVAELAVYLGKHAATSIIGKILIEQPESQEVLTAIEPSLKGFLGRDAAAAVATKIVHLLEPGAEAPLLQSG